MRNVGDKIAASFLDPLRLGEIAKHGDGASAGQRSSGHVESAAGNDGRSTRSLDLPGIGCGLDGGEEVGVANGFNHRSIQTSALRNEAVHGLVRPLHEAVGADGNDRVLHAVEQSFELMLAGVHGGECALDPAGRLIDSSGDEADLVERGIRYPGLEVSVSDASGDIHDAL